MSFKEIKKYSKKQTIKMSKFLSLILRHNPSCVDLELDKNGYVNVKELIKNIPDLTFEFLEYIVETDEKCRYSFNSNKTKIRANQGHSINVDVQLEQKIPPEYLYHGTSLKNKDSIFKNGLHSASRQFVHLTDDVDSAFRIGSRHGIPIVLKIETKNVKEKFYLSLNNVWLCKFIDSNCIVNILYK